MPKNLFKKKKLVGKLGSALLSRVASSTSLVSLMQKKSERVWRGAPVGNTSSPCDIIAGLSGGSSLRRPQLCATQLEVEAADVASAASQPAAAAAADFHYVSYTSSVPLPPL